MKKLLLLSLLISTVCLADPRREEAKHDRAMRERDQVAAMVGGDRFHDHREWHEHGGHGFGWGEFVGGIILGGIIAHEVNGRWYDDSYHEVRRITVCEDVMVRDAWGNPVRDFYGNFVVTKRCHDEWVYVN